MKRKLSTVQDQRKEARIDAQETIPAILNTDVLYCITRHFNAKTLREWLLVSKYGRSFVLKTICRTAVGDKARALALDFAQCPSFALILRPDNRVFTIPAALCLREWPLVMMKMARRILSPIGYSNYNKFRDFALAIGVENVRPFITKKWKNGVISGCLAGENCECPCSLLLHMTYVDMCPRAPRKAPIRRIL